MSIFMIVLSMTGKEGKVSLANGKERKSVRVLYKEKKSQRKRLRSQRRSLPSIHKDA